MKVVVLVPGSEGTPTVKSVMNLRVRPDDDSGNEYLPLSEVVLAIYLCMHST